MRTIRSFAAAALLLIGGSARGQAVARYPAIPEVLPDSEEIALAETAAPPEISKRAAVYTIRRGKVQRIREGSNGCACMVSRDLHEGSLYPICYDALGSRTRMLRELMELRLRLSGAGEPEVRRQVAEAMKQGQLPMPDSMTVAYMMSSRQVLFSSPDADGVRVGAWSPHLMIMGPGLTAAGLGLLEPSKVSLFSVSAVDGHSNELVIRLASWSDGTPTRK